MANGLAFPFHPADPFGLPSAMVEGEPEAYGLFSSPYQFFPFFVPLIPFRFKWSVPSRKVFSE